MEELFNINGGHSLRAAKEKGNGEGWEFPRAQFQDMGWELFLSAVFEVILEMSGSPIKPFLMLFWVGYERFHHPPPDPVIDRLPPGQLAEEAL
jgi:hypothetical protein